MECIARPHPRPPWGRARRLSQHEPMPNPPCSSSQAAWALGVTVSGMGLAKSLVTLRPAASLGPLAIAWPEPIRTQHIRSSLAMPLSEHFQSQCAFTTHLNRRHGQPNPPRTPEQNLGAPLPAAMRPRSPGGLDAKISSHDRFVRGLTRKETLNMVYAGIRNWAKPAERTNTAERA